MDPFDTYFKKATKSLFRFEGLQDYSAEDGDEFTRKFLETGILPIDPRDDSWCQEMKKKNEDGMITQRVRLVKRPLNAYTIAELAWHKEAAAFSGDDIRIVEEEVFSALFPNGLDDYWMMDDTYVTPLMYGEHGKYLKSALITGPEALKYIEYKDALLKAAIPISEAKISN